MVVELDFEPVHDGDGSVGGGLVLVDDFEHFLVRDFQVLDELGALHVHFGFQLFHAFGEPSENGDDDLLGLESPTFIWGSSQICG